MTQPIPGQMLSSSEPSANAPAIAHDADLFTALRTVMSFELRNPDPTGRWNRLERGETAFNDFCDYLDAQHHGVADFFRSSAGQLMSTLPIRADVVERLRALRVAGFSTALLTNNVAEWRPLWRAKLSEASALDLFDAIVDSSEVGMRKPEERMYLHTVGLLGIAPDQALFLDDFAHNVEGARAAGLQAIHVTGGDDHLAALDQLVVQGPANQPR